MLDITSLPKVPKDALLVVLNIIADKLEPLEKIKLLNDYNDHFVDELGMDYKIANWCMQKCEQNDLTEFAAEKLRFERNKLISNAVTEIKAIINYLSLKSLDDHLLSQAEIQKYDRANLSKDEKLEISTHLQAARSYAFNADFLSKSQKKNILYYINRAESELLKEETSFQSFLAAAYMSSSLLNRVGEDAKPLAEAIQIATSKTEASVEGQRKIAAEEKPKQLERPKNE